MYSISGSSSTTPPDQYPSWTVTCQSMWKWIRKRKKDANGTRTRIPTHARPEHAQHCWRPVKRGMRTRWSQPYRDTHLGGPPPGTTPSLSPVPQHVSCHQWTTQPVKNPQNWVQTRTIGHVVTGKFRQEPTISKYVFEFSRQNKCTLIRIGGKFKLLEILV
jgi:hypothetical protein